MVRISRPSVVVVDWEDEKNWNNQEADLAAGLLARAIQGFRYGPLKNT
jgi:hypothetical protein